MTIIRNYYIIKVSNDTMVGGDNLKGETKARIESELEVSAYIQNLKYALDNGAKSVYTRYVSI